MNDQFAALKQLQCHKPPDLDKLTLRYGDPTTESPQELKAGLEGLAALGFVRKKPK